MGGQQQSESYADLPGHLLQDFLFMEQEEIWQPIVGFEGYYEVSNTGKVRSLKRHVKSALKNNRTVNRKGAITKQFLRDNYYAVRLYKGGKPKNKRVNILVCTAFVSNPDSKPCVNHKDTDKLNNHHLNLEWCTVAENRQHAIANGLIKFCTPSKIMTPEKQLQVVKMRDAGIKQYEIAAHFNVNQSVISRILNSKRNYNAINQIT